MEDVLRVQKNRWFKRYEDQNGHKDVKGIFLKETIDFVQLRIRFRKDVQSQLESKISFSVMGNKCVIRVPVLTLASSSNVQKHLQKIAI
jgi:hypothetical protein